MPASGGLDYRYVKDVVHGFIYLPRSLFSLIDSPLFQRLRSIAQTGLARLVYPGLSHTRFEHSLGVAYAMSRAVANMARNTRLLYQSYRARLAEPDEVQEAVIDAALKLADSLADPQTEELAALVGLLHDIGHLAWSHVFEKAFLVAVEEAQSSPHETLTIRVAETLLTRLCPLRNHRLCKRAIDILEKAYIRGENHCTIELTLGAGSKIRTNNLVDCILARLLSSSVDLDRADYVLRDSLHSGVTFGHIDLERLYNVLVLATRITDRGGNIIEVEFEPAILDKGVSTAENLLIGRVYMYNEVYLHNIVLYYNTVAQKYLTILMRLATEIKGLDSCGEASMLCRLLNCMNIAAIIVAGKETEEIDEETLEEYLHVLTDPFIEASLRLFAYPALGRIELAKAKPVQDYLRSDPAAAVALIALADTIVARRKAPVIIIPGEHATKAQSRVKHYGDVSYIITSINRDTWFAAINTYSFKAIKDTVWVVDRQDLLHPRSLTDYPLAITSRQIANKEYAKILATIIPPVDDIRDFVKKIRAALGGRAILKNTNRTIDAGHLAEKTITLLGLSANEKSIIIREINKQIKDTTNKLSKALNEIIK